MNKILVKESGGTRYSNTPILKLWLVRMVGADLFVSSSKRCQLGKMSGAAIFRTQKSADQGVKDSLKGYINMRRIMFEQQDESLFYDWHNDYCRDPNEVEFDADSYVLAR